MSVRYAPIGDVHRFHIRDNLTAVFAWLYAELGPPVAKDGGPGRWFTVQNVQFVVVADADAVATRLRWG